MTRTLLRLRPHSRYTNSCISFIVWIASQIFFGVGSPVLKGSSRPTACRWYSSRQTTAIQVHTVFLISLPQPESTSGWVPPLVAFLLMLSADSASRDSQPKNSSIQQRTCKSKFQDWVGLFSETLGSRISSVGGTPTDSHVLGGPMSGIRRSSGFPHPYWTWRPAPCWSSFWGTLCTRLARS